MKVSTNEVKFNPYEPGFFSNPYPFYERLRDHDPIHYSFMGTWVLSRYKDVNELLTHNALSSDLRNWVGFEKRYKDKELIAWMINHSVLNIDPPTHTSLRSYLKKSFMPKALEELNNAIKNNVRKQLEKLEGRDEIDLINDFALPVPLSTINYIFNIPEEDQKQVKEWSSNISKLIEPLPNLSALKVANQSILDFTAYLKDRIAERKGKNGTDFISNILNTPIDQLIDHDDYILPNLILMFAAAHETIVNLIGNGMYALLKNPDQYALLQDRPELIETAIEEMLRFDSPQQLAWRSVLEDINLVGHDFKKGEQLMLLIGAANFDPLYFPDPYKFDITRKPNKHLTFGKGKHSCMGSWMARMEAKIAIPALIRQFPNMCIDDSQTKWLKNFSFRGLERAKLDV